MGILGKARYKTRIDTCIMRIFGLTQQRFTLREPGLLAMGCVRIILGYFLKNAPGVGIALAEVERLANAKMRHGTSRIAGIGGEKALILRDGAEVLPFSE